MYNEKAAEKEIEVNYNYLSPQQDDADPADPAFPNYIERHLIIEDNQFIIVPNGGTGDCLFKAIAQAMSDEDDEACHLDIRVQVVNFVTNEMWDKLKDSIEIQHISGNSELIELWSMDPVKCYREYMTQGGTLGSFIELTAAAQLLQFNFSSIQEYSKDVKTYRVENFDGRSGRCSSSSQNQDQNQKAGEESENDSKSRNRPHYYFLFTGDYESGHWESKVIPPVLIRLTESQQQQEGDLLVFVARENLNDGTYHGVLYIVIDGVQTSVDDWLSDMDEKSKQLTFDRANGDSGSQNSESEEEDESHRRDADHNVVVATSTDQDVSGKEERLNQAPLGSQEPTDILTEILRTKSDSGTRPPAGVDHSENSEKGHVGDEDDDDDDDRADDDDYDGDEDDWEETVVTNKPITATVGVKDGQTVVVAGRVRFPEDQSAATVSAMHSSSRGESRSKRKVTSRLFGTSSSMRSKSRATTARLGDKDKKRGCFKTFVSYVSSMLR